MLRRLFFKKEQVRQLGRWNYEKSNIKSLLANIDSCGDTMCGDPLAYKQEMDKEIKEFIRLKEIEKLKEEEEKTNKKNLFKFISRFQ